MKFPALPFHVAVSAGIIAAVIISFGILYPLLGGARDDAISQNASLQTQITSLMSGISQSSEDYRFVLENQSRYEDLVSGDRLIPHTRRTAIRHMQEIALRYGLTKMSYNFSSVGEQSALTASNQPQTGLYRISLESVELDVGAPLDGPVFNFLTEVVDTFPGSAVVQSLELFRADQITTAALNQVSNGEDSGLVNGHVELLWRTAIQSKEEASLQQGR